MPHPLSPTVHRHAKVHLYLAHLERRGVAVAHQVANQRPIFGHLFRPRAVRHPRRLHHRLVPAHYIHYPHEAVVQDGELYVQKRFGHFAAFFRKDSSFFVFRFLAGAKFVRKSLQKLNTKYFADIVTIRNFVT
jgi:hypothetical protein